MRTIQSGTYLNVTNVKLSYSEEHLKFCVVLASLFIINKEKSNYFNFLVGLFSFYVPCIV
jgi:hypothetical protein